MGASHKTLAGGRQLPDRNAKSSNHGEIYVVRRGDSLWSISKKLTGAGSNWSQLLIANRSIKDPNLILIGQRLRIPDSMRSADLTSGVTNVTGVSGKTGPAYVSNEDLSCRALPGSNASGVRGIQSHHDDWTDLLSKRRARPFMWPGIEYNLDLVPPTTIHAPTGTFVYRLTGKIKISDTRLPGITMSVPNGDLKVEAKSNTDSVLKNIYSGAVLTPDGKGGAKVTLQLFATASDRNGTIATSSVSLQPPSTIVYKFEPRPISTKIGDYKIEGKSGMQVEFTPHDPGSASVPSARKLPAITPIPKEVAILLFVGAAALLVGTILEDVATAGAGIADDPVSFGVAATMFEAGAAAF